jgi:hypothetical protein
LFDVAQTANFEDWRAATFFDLLTPIQATGPPKNDASKLLFALTEYLKTMPNDQTVRAHDVIL